MEGDIYEIPVLTQIRNPTKKKLLFFFPRIGLCVSEVVTTFRYSSVKKKRRKSNPLQNNMVTENGR